MHSEGLKTAAKLAGQDVGVTFHVLPGLHVSVEIYKAYDQATAHRNVQQYIQAIRRYYKGAFWIDYEYINEAGALLYEKIYITNLNTYESN